MSLKAWPFLVSRNLYLDYRTVVAPDFICKAQISNLLARAADGDLTGKNKVIFRKIVGSKVGDLSLVFQVHKGTNADLRDSRETSILKDSFGREIYLIKGLVFNKYLDTIGITARDFAALDYQLQQAYCKFWNLTEACLSEPSIAFDFYESINSEEFLNIQAIEPFQLNLSQGASNISGKLELEFTLTTNEPLSSISFDPKGLFLVSRGVGQTIEKWSLEKKEKVKQLFEVKSSESLPSTIVFSSDGKYIASGVTDGSSLNRRNYVWLWDDSKEQQEKFLFEKGIVEPDLKAGNILTTVFSHDGQILASQYFSVKN